MMRESERKKKEEDWKRREEVEGREGSDFVHTVLR